MNRRAFIAGLGCAAAWPVVAIAGQNGEVRRIGVLMIMRELRLHCSNHENRRER